MASSRDHHNNNVHDDDQDDAVSHHSLNPNPNFNLNIMNINFNNSNNNNDDEDDDIDDDDVDVDVDVDVDADADVEAEAEADEDSTSSTDPPSLVVHHHHNHLASPALPPPPIPTATAGQVTIALPTPDKRLSDVTIATAVVDEKKPYPIDESRKLFQRLWTDEDEMELLQGFLEYTTQRGANNSSHHHDTTAFYDQIKSKLQLDFNKNQLVEKLRRLKKKYRNVMQKMSSGKDYVFKSPHDQATFEVSRKIWSGIGSVASPAVRIGGASGGAPAAIDEGGYEDDDPSPNPNPNFHSALIDYSPNPNGVDDRKIPIRSRKRPRASGVGVSGGGGGGMHTPQFSYQPVTLGVPPQTSTPTVTAAAAAATNVIEETVKSCLSPIFKELLQSVTNLNNGPRGLGGLAFSPMPLGTGFGIGGGIGNVDMTDERWKKQQILELEVFSRRLELVQDQIKAQLEELKGRGG